MDFLNNGDNNKEFLDIFKSESENILDRIFNNISSLEKVPNDREITSAVYRDLHSLKGVVRMAGFNNIQTIIHKTEDIFDAVKNGRFCFEECVIRKISHALGVVSIYLLESVKSEKEVIDEDFSAVISDLEYILEIEIQKERQKSVSPAAYVKNRHGIPAYRDEISRGFNYCFTLLDGIIPEQETQDIAVLREEVEKIYDCFKNSDLYDIKNSLENFLAKTNSNETGCFTMSEILELRNELNAAAAKFAAICIKTEDKNLTFFDLAGKIGSCQTSSIDFGKLFEELRLLKDEIENQKVLETADLIEAIFEHIKANSIQPDEHILSILKNSLEYCAESDGNINGDLIIRELKETIRLFGINYRQDSLVDKSGSIALQTDSPHIEFQEADKFINLLDELNKTRFEWEKQLSLIQEIRKDFSKSIGDLELCLKYPQDEDLKNTLSLLSETFPNMAKTACDLDALYNTLRENFDKMKLISDELKTTAKTLKAVPVAAAFGSFSRMVKDMAEEKGKEINFKIEGKDTCIDRKIIEEIKTPLMHIVINSIDHGIETREERIAKGKNPAGMIVLSAQQDENKFIIDITDDGRGFDTDKIKDKAVSGGFLTLDEINSMPDENITDIIFLPGFTTEDTVTNISGRGIGLDEVKTRVTNLHGSVKAISENGSRIHIELPSVP